jgi:hypothetical protein
MQEGERGAGQVLDIFGKAAAAAEPRKCSLDDPPLRKHFKALRLVRALDDLQLPIAERPHGGGRRSALVSTVSEDPLDEGKRPARLLEQRQGAVAILDVGGVDVCGEDQAERVDQDVALLAFDLLPGVIARRVDTSAPFSALFTLWLSMIATLGLASLPASSLAWTNSAWCKRISVPSQSQS